MSACPVCSGKLDSFGRCLTCGASAEQATPPTEMLRTSDGSATPTPKTAADHFAPGTILADRYRIVALLGRGGMGHVYRAEDMKLGQTVALKFLPPSMTDDSRHLELMLSEVRLARQVSSPYVCRVHDIVEAGGLRFLSMEYVDGENLATLLRRIRRLPADRAQEVAWQICEGLGAAHAMGVLHRDLKPANLMIDGLGRPKITDFGLALDVEDAAAKSEVAGTPGYIAPEVAHGQPVSVQSDLFGLGAILYEIYTGHRAVESGTPAKAGASSISTRASAHFPKDVPRAVQLIILQCLEADPAKRPRSAREVAAAFPVRDALALAEAAGETPSPEMVAAAGSDEPLALWKAWAILLFIFATMTLLPYTARWIFTPALDPWAGPPQHFEALTQNLLKQLGYTAPPSDSYYYLEANEAMIADHVRHVDRGEQLGTGPRTSQEAGRNYEQGLDVYVYRQQATGLLHSSDPFDNLDWNDPAANQPGMINVKVDSRGHLLDFLAIPASEVPATGTVQEPDWRAAFAAAGIDPAKMAEVPAAIVPAVPFDWRKQWRGPLPGYPATQIQVVATGFAGKLTAFRVLGPWDLVEDSQKSTISTWQLGIWALLPVAGALVLAFFAVRNWRRNRADTAGALRLAFIVAVLYFFRCVFAMRFQPDPLILGSRVPTFLAWAFLWGSLSGLAYVAIEPYLRRKVPRLLISWTRLMKGQVRNPLVGKDILAGIALLCAEYPIGTLFVWWNGHTRSGRNFPVTGNTMRAMYEPLSWLGNVCDAVYYSIYIGLFIMSLYYVFRAVFRVRVLAIALLGIFLFFFGGGPPHYSHVDYILVNLAVAFLSTFCALRFGLLSTVVFAAVGALEFSGPITFDFSQWYALATTANLALVVALAIFAFWNAIGDQRIFGNFKLDD